MEDTFEKRVRAAAAATWWTVLVAFIFLMLHWLLYLILTGLQPAWLLRLWVPAMDWQFVRTVWFWGNVGIKILLGLLALAALWLTLWSRQLRKNGRKESCTI